MAQGAARPTIFGPRCHCCGGGSLPFRDRKSTRLNSSHLVISYAVFCLKKKKKTRKHTLFYHDKAFGHAELSAVILVLAKYNAPPISLSSLPRDSQYVCLILKRMLQTI